MNPSDILKSLDPLYAAVVCDVLDTLGYRNQTLPSRIQPLTPTKEVRGRVYTARAEAVAEIPAEPYKLEIGAVEAMDKGDVLLVDGADNDTCGFWGELLTTACIYKGVRGVVMTACTRDLWGLSEAGFPVFGIGCHPADSKGRADIVEIGQPISIDDVKARTGDYILGDEDGVVVIPGEIAVDAIRKAQEKVSGENVARADLANGVPMGEVFRKYGIL
jgi:4-hydroxy-4-methyl-2-oxoglutarate aldolase